jgi:hypothetical protein
VAFALIYSNKDILYLRNKKIIEFDIKEGGYSCSLNHNLLSDKEKEDLIKLNKHDRHVYLGKKALKEKTFTKELHKAFQFEVNNFIEKNEINPDHVLSIKKDSITFYNSDIKEDTFNNVQFTKRYEFSSYLKLGRLEFYYDRKTDNFLFKGISLENYEDTLFEEIKKILKLKEYKSDKDIFPLLQDMRSSYLNKELVHSYYKELGPSNGFRLLDNYSGYDVTIGNITDDQIDLLDIRYNYINIILPLTEIFI